jgi:dCTP diphosphatase
MTIAPKSSSPNCVRSLEAALATADGMVVVHGKPNDQPPDGVEEAGEKCQRSPTPSPQQTSTAGNNETFPVALVRNLIFRLSALTGSLALVTLRDDADASFDDLDIASLVELNSESIMARMLATLMRLAASLSIDLHVACHKKIDLNAKKYPVELCKGKSEKYTEYSNVTGISKTAGQSTLEESDSTNPCDVSNASWDEINEYFLAHAVPALTARTRQFAADRDWHRYHTPRNLLLALTGELGELAEIFQFKGDEPNQQLSMKEQDKIKQEIADVTIYLLRLADVSGVCLSDASKRI